MTEKETKKMTKKILTLFFASAVILSAILFLAAGCTDDSSSSGQYSNDSPISVTENGENTAYLTGDQTSVKFRIALQKSWKIINPSKNVANISAKSSMDEYETISINEYNVTPLPGCIIQPGYYATPSQGNGFGDIITVAVPQNNNGFETIIELPIVSANDENVVLATISIVHSSITPPQKKAWLFIQFIAGDNHDILPYQLSNINQMEKVGSDENTHLVTYIDIGKPAESYSPAWDKAWKESIWSKSIKWDGARAYYIPLDIVVTEGTINSMLVERYGDVDSGSADFLQMCVCDAIRKYPADNVCLILNNHGGGFDGAMQDQTTGSIMLNPDINEALINVMEATGKKIDLLGYDACLMAEIEAVYEYKDAVSYIVASEEATGGPGWAYDDILSNKQVDDVNYKNTSGLFSAEIMTDVMQNVQKKYKNTGKIGADVTPLQLANMIFETCKKYPENIKTISVIDTSELSDLRAKIQTFTEIVRDLNDVEQELIAETMLTNPDGTSANIYDKKGIYDLYNMMDSIEKNPDINESVLYASGEIKGQINKTVVSNWNAGDKYKYSYGLTICANNNLMSSLIYSNLNFTKDTYWKFMIREILN